MKFIFNCFKCFWNDLVLEFKNMNDKLEEKKTFENNEVNRTLYIVVMYKSLFTRDRKIFFCG